MCAGCEFREGGGEGGGVRTEASGGGCRGSAAVLPAAAAGLVGDGLHLGARLHRAGQLDLPHPLRVAVCRQRRPESALRYAARGSRWAEWGAGSPSSLLSLLLLLSLLDISGARCPAVAAAAGVAPLTVGGPESTCDRRSGSGAAAGRAFGLDFADFAASARGPSLKTELQRCGLRAQAAGTQPAAGAAERPHLAQGNAGGWRAASARLLPQRPVTGATVHIGHEIQRPSARREQPAQ